jgi:immune inhibitor A
MRRTRLVALATASLLSTAGTLSLATTPAGAAPADTSNFTAPDAPVLGKVVSDVKTPKWREKYDARNQAAFEQKVRSGSTADSIKLGKGKYGRAGTAQQDNIFVVLAQFGNAQHAAYSGQAPDAQRVDGPMHNEIPEPDRKVDNSTQWQSDYDHAHYEDMYFNRMRKFYEQQSSGHYTIDGDVTEWVTVPFNEARYGRNYCGSNVCASTWYLVRDALAQWTKDRLDSGMTMTEIQDYLKTFDHQDRYDFDGDGDFNEPDGYIDHFQIVHAGGDEADGDPVYGSDAIWSHRWNVGLEPYGTGPGPQVGGIEVGEGGTSNSTDGPVSVPDNPTGIWVSDYTIQPENGGLSVFAHEFGHDLGLPDLYDTSGNTGGASNTVEHWSLMSQSRGTAKGDEGIGGEPMSFGAWEKMQLGWLNYKTVEAGKSATVKIAPNSSNSMGNKAVLAVLPDKQVEFNYGAPCAECGSKYYYSGQGNDLDNTMTRTVAGGGALTAKVRYDAETDYDYVYLETSSDNGANWASVPTSESDEGMNGFSGSTGGEWVDLTADVPAGTNAIRWRYVTDGGVAEAGFQVDNITLGGTTIGDAETDADWTLDGFTATSGTETRSFMNGYIVDNRQFVGNDKLLAHIYNWVNLHSRTEPNKVEFFHNEPGALISYWDTSYTDNGVGDHPGAGQILPIDAHDQLVHLGDQLLRTKIQTLDSTFGLKRTQKQTVHLNGEVVKLPSRKAVRMFDDSKSYWHDCDKHGCSDHPGSYKPGWMGVDVPNTGTTIKVLKINKKGVMTVKVN